MSRRLGFAAVMTLAALALAGCASSEPRAITQEEAERIATFRFQNYRDEEVNYALEGPADSPLRGSVTIKTQDHVGYGDAGLEGSLAPLAWGQSSLFISTDPANITDLATWSGRDIQDSATDRFLVILLMLSQDRPDNPQLLQQSATAWVGTDSVDGASCDVFTGPGQEGVQNSQVDPLASPVRYCVDKDGKLLKFSAQIDSDQWWVATRTDKKPTSQIPAQVFTALDQAQADRQGSESEGNQ